MFSFPKERRLLSKQDYNHVFQQAKKIVNAEFIILYRSNTFGHARLGLAISKKMIAKAHDRNRVKRILREIFRTRSLPSIDLIVLAKKGSDRVENKIMITNLSKTWDKILAT